MRLPLVYRLIDNDTVFEVTAMMGDAIKAERQYKMGAADFIDPHIWLEPLCFMLHSRLLHLQRRGQSLNHSAVEDSLDGFLDHQLADVGLKYRDNGEVNWIGANDYTFALVGSDVGEEGERIATRPWDMIRAERHYGERGERLIRRAEVHGFLVHSAVHRRNFAAGGSTMPLGDFTAGEKEGSLEWVDEVESDDLEVPHSAEDATSDDETTEAAPGATILGPFEPPPSSTPPAWETSAASP